MEKSYESHQLCNKSNLHGEMSPKALYTFLDTLHLFKFVKSHQHDMQIIDGV